MDRLDFNRRTQSKPLAIVYCKSTKQVSKTVMCASRFKSRVVSRSGGHSFEGYSVQDGVVVADLSLMNDVKVNVKVQTAVIGAGARLGRVYSSLWSAGRWAFPGGTASPVGFSGLVLGGGFGFLTRKYGLASDQVVALQAVLANGTIVNADSKSQTDLLWACQGGGGGQYAIVTSWTVKVYQQPEGSGSYAVSWKWAFSVSQAVKAMNWYQMTVPGMDERYSGDFTIHGDRGGYIKVGGVYLGTKTEAVAAFTAAGLFAALGKPLADSGHQNNLNSTLGYSYNPAPLYFKSHSVMQMALMPVVALQNMAQAIADGQATLPKQSPDIEFEIQWHPLGGQVGKLSDTATAFPYRSALFNAKLRAAWDRSEAQNASLAWLAKIQSAVSAYQSNTAYSAYIDSDLGASSAEKYFSQNLPRLRTVKGMYDPTNFFKFPNSVAPA